MRREFENLLGTVAAMRMCEETPRRATDAAMHDGAIDEGNPSKGVNTVRGQHATGHGDMG